MAPLGQKQGDGLLLPNTASRRQTGVVALSRRVEKESVIWRVRGPRVHLPYIQIPGTSYAPEGSAAVPPETLPEVEVAPPLSGWTSSST